MPTPPVVVRFAPSPSGYLHVGGARTAIFNWLYARRQKGRFILRIEDTDAERSTAESVAGIIESLEWLGLDWDEGPNFQSHSLTDHQAAARKLLAGGQAYRCFCTREVLEQKREAARAAKAPFRYDGTCRDLSVRQADQKEAQGLPYTVRFKVPREPGAVYFDDRVYGRIEKQYADIEDFVVVRSNATPLYVLSNAVDDIRDGVTHIIRGQDGLANTPKQILIYHALGAPVPVFAHMSLALDPQKAKISKRRHGEKVAVHYYRDNGFLPWGLFNFLALLGWSTTEARQIYTLPELIDAFTLEGLSKTNCIFDVRQNDPKFFTDPKALSINAHHLRHMAATRLEPYVRIELEKKGLWDDAFAGDRQEWFRETIDLIRGRCHLLTDFATVGQPYFSDDFPSDPKAVAKHILKHESLRRGLPVLARRLEATDPFTARDAEKTLREAMAELDLKPGVLVNAIRTAVTGQSVGPDFMSLLICLGRDRVARRLRRAGDFFA